MTSPDDASGESALHVAVSMNHEVVVSQLLELGASLEVQDFAGKTVVMTACEYGHLQTLECLATRGINAAGTCTHTASLVELTSVSQTLAFIFQQLSLQYIICRYVHVHVHVR